MTLLQGCFLRFLNYTNAIKLRKVSHMETPNLFLLEQLTQSNKCTCCWSKAKHNYKVFCITIWFQSMAPRRYGKFHRSSSSNCLALFSDSCQVGIETNKFIQYFIKNSVRSLKWELSWITVKNSQISFKNLAVWALQDFRIMFNQFSTLCKEGLREKFRNEFSV